MFKGQVGQTYEGDWEVRIVSDDPNFWQVRFHHRRFGKREKAVAAAQDMAARANFQIQWEDV